MFSRANFLVTAFNALDSCELKPGQWLGIIGCGGLGQLATQYGKAMGLKVIGLDISDANLAVTKEQGADYIINTLINKSYKEELKTLTGGGVHAACLFSNADIAFANAPSIIRLGGTMMVIGESFYSIFHFAVFCQVMLTNGNRSAKE